MARILLCGGGSIGHVAPLAAVRRAVLAIEPGTEFHAACSAREEEEKFLEKEGIPHTVIGGRRLTPLTAPMMVLRSWLLLNKFRPDVVLTKGGGVAVPLAFAAWLCRIPIVVHESDATPGRATRLIGRWAKTVCRGWRNGIGIFTGNPIRPEVTRGSREEGLRLTGFSGTRPILLVTGGSQGALALNRAVTDHQKELLEFVDIAHITGAGKPGGPAAPSYWTTPFAYGELAHLYAIADMALSRAGAGAIGELSAAGIPMLLVPLRGVASDHQYANACAARDAAGCVVIDQEDLTTKLVPAVRRLAEKPDVRRELSTKGKSLYEANAAVSIGKILLAAAKEHCGVS